VFNYACLKITTFQGQILFLTEENICKYMSTLFIYIMFMYQETFYMFEKLKYNNKTVPDNKI
jgi:hypothetical protein